MPTLLPTPPTNAAVAEAGAFRQALAENFFAYDEIRAMPSADQEALFHLLARIQEGDTRLRGARITDGWRPRDDDHWHPRVALTDGGENLPARHARHQQIGQNDVVAVLVEQRQGLGAPARSVRGVA